MKLLLFVALLAALVTVVYGYVFRTSDWFSVDLTPRENDRVSSYRWTKVIPSSLNIEAQVSLF